MIPSFRTRLIHVMSSVFVLGAAIMTLFGATAWLATGSLADAGLPAAYGLASGSIAGLCVGFVTCDEAG